MSIALQITLVDRQLDVALAGMASEGISLGLCLKGCDLPFEGVACWDQNCGLN